VSQYRSNPPSNSERELTASLVQSEARGSLTPARLRTLETRVDPPHELRTASSQSPPETTSATTSLLAGTESHGSAADLDKPEALRQQLRCQARQLAGHFAARQQRLDHREAELHVRLAELETDERQSRLSAIERLAELEMREAHLLERERELAGRLSSATAAEAHLEAARRDVRHREEIVADRWQRLDELQQRLDAQNEALAAAGARLEEQRTEVSRQFEVNRQAINVQRQAATEQVRRVLTGLEQRRVSFEIEAARARANWTANTAEASDAYGAIGRANRLAAEQLAAWEVNLVEAEARLAARERALEPRRLRLAARLRAARRRLRDRAQSAGRQLQRQWQRCEQERKLIRRRAMELEELRTTIAAEHGDLLKLRLSTEGLLADLARSLPGDSWQQHLAETREQIAHHYRHREARLHNRQQALAQLQEEIALAHRRLALERRLHARQVGGPANDQSFDDAA
jgi:hypothetical protein